MHSWWLALVGALAVGVALFVSLPGSPAATSVVAVEEQEDSPPGEVVVVRRHTSGAAVFAQGLEPPTLEEMGFEVVPVPEGMTSSEYIAQLENDPGVRSVEPDAIVRGANEPNDPYYPGSQRQYMETINVPKAWELAVGREEIVVAVLDTGIDLGHPDLAPRLWINPWEVAGNGIDSDGNGCIDDVHGCRFTGSTPENSAICGYPTQTGAPTGNVSDDHGIDGHSHGTMVSGLFGAAGDNGEGIAGVAWNIRIMPVKVLDCARTGRVPDLAHGIQYAREMGAHVINLSLAIDPSQPGANSSMVRAAIAAAEAEGIIVVVAAGNFRSGETTGVGYPAANTEFSNLVAVGASNWQSGNTWQPHSRYGPQVDFAAPDTPLVTTARRSMVDGLPYVQTREGTSFATPLVSGMFALMMSANPRLGHEAYIEMARNAATPAPAAPHGQEWAGSGIINVGGAVEQVPMLVTGVPLHNWVDVPAGTHVEARINGTRCGETESIAIGPAARFELTVAPAAVQPGCGAPGDDVTIYVGGAPTNRVLTWAGPTGQLLHTGQEASTVSPPPGSVIVQPLHPGWNNIAHFEGSKSISDGIEYLPQSWEALFRWVPESFGAMYIHAFRDVPEWAQTWKTISRYDAFWVYVPSDGTAATLNPNAPKGRTLSLDQGWNNFVYTGTSAPMAEALKQIDGAYLGVHQFDSETADWKRHFPSQPRYANSLGGLLHTGVYWIYMSEPATLTMN